MTAINKQLTRHEIEELLPWNATGTLSGREAERIEQALAATMNWHNVMSWFAGSLPRRPV
jgi:hypothetical protein